MKTKPISTRLLACLLAIVMLLGIMPVSMGALTKDFELTITLSKGLSAYFYDTLEAITADCANEPDKHEHSMKVSDFTTTEDGSSFKLTGEKAYWPLSLIIEADNNTVDAGKTLSFDGDVIVAFDGDNIDEDEKKTYFYYTIEKPSSARGATLAFNVVTPQINISLPSQFEANANGYTIQNVDGANVTLTYGNNAVEVDKTAQFTLQMDAGLEKSTVNVYKQVGTDETYQPIDPENDPDNANKKNGKYTYKLTAGDADIKITISIQPARTITLPLSNEQYTIQPQGVQNVFRDEPFQFEVTAKPGWKIDSVVANSQTLTPGLEPEHKNQYTIAAGKDAVTVQITASKQTYSVKLDPEGVQGKNYTVTGIKTTVAHGDTLTFTVTPSANYDAPQVSVEMVGVEPDNVHLSATAGFGNSKTYTLYDVTGDVTIKISEPGKTQRNITFSTVTGVTYKHNEDPVSGIVKANEGEDYTFTVALDEAHDQSKFKVFVDGVEVKEEDGKYKVSKEQLTKDVTVSVTGVTVNTYEVTVTNNLPVGYDVSYNSDTVEYHGNFTLTVKPKEGYADPTVTVSFAEHGKDAPAENAKTETLQGKNGVYTLAGHTNKVVGPITFTITGDKKKLEGSKLPDEPKDGQEGTPPKEWKGFELTDESGNPLKLDNIEYGSSITFKVKADPGYHIDSVSAERINGGGTFQNAAVRKSDGEGAGGTYSITYITEPIKLDVEVSPVTYTVTFVDEKATGSRQAAMRAVTPQSSQEILFNVENDNFDPETGKLKETALPTMAGAADGFKGIYNCTWTISGDGFNNRTCTQEQLPEVLALQHTNKNITVTATYTVNWDKVYVLKMDAKWNSPAESQKFSLTITTSVTDPTLITELNKTTIQGFGVCYSTANAITGVDQMRLYLASKNDFNWTTDSYNNATILNGMPFSTQVQQSFTFSFTLGGIQENTTMHLLPWMVINYDGTKIAITPDAETTTNTSDAKKEDTPVEDGPSMEEAPAYDNLEIFDGERSDCSDAGDIELNPSEPEVPIAPEPVEPAPVAPMPVAENDVAA